MNLQIAKVIKSFIDNKRHAYYHPKKRILNDNYWTERERLENEYVVDHEERMYYVGNHKECTYVNVGTKRDSHGKRWWKHKDAGKVF